MRPSVFLAARLALAATLLGPLGAMAPIAQADASDDAFLGALKAKGINFPNPAAAIIAGHEVCNELEREHSRLLPPVLRVVFRLYTGR